MKMLFLVLVAILVAVSAAGCSKTATTTTSATTQSSMPPLTTSSVPAGPTFGSLSQTGQVVFANNCGTCHGDKGQGGTAPAVIGSSANPGKYNTAKGLLDFISTAMPLNAPGSLSHQEYLDVLSYLLVQNNFAFPATQFNESGLSNIELK